MKRLLLALAVLTGLPLVAIPVAARLHAGRVLADVEARAFTPEQAERFLADGARIAALGVLPSGGGTRDAGARLNAWVTLDDDDTRAPDATAPWMDLDTAALKCPPGDGTWPACVTDVPSVDLAWMAELPTYDTWDPTSSGPLARWLAANPDAAHLLAPIPSYAPFVNAARARLLQGRARGDMAAALAETRALARLLASHEWLIAELFAVALLNIERAAYEDAVANGLDVGGHVPVAEADTAAMKRYLSALILIYAGEAPAGTLERLERAAPGFPGRCAAILEAMGTRAGHREILDGRWPGELDRRAALAALDAAATDGRCRLPHVGRAWRGETGALALAAVMATEEPGTADTIASLSLRTPWVRQAVYAELVAAMDGNFNHYGE